MTASQGGSTPQVRAVRLAWGDQPTAGRRHTIRVLIAFAIAATCIFARLGDLPLLQPDEGRNAEVAREMLATRAWLVPTYDGLPYLDKPAFYFRAVAISFALGGESELAARMPSALSGLLLLALIYAFCRHAYDGRTAALAVIVVGTAPLYIAFARIVIFDMTLALFVCAAVLSGYMAETGSGTARRRWYWVGAMSAGLATLVKGPVGFILPTLVLLVFFRVDGRRGAARRFFAPANIAIFLAIVIPWFVGVTLRHPDFAYYGLVRESVARFTTTSFDRTAPAYYYIPVIAGVFFPWSVLLPEAVVVAWRRRSDWARADRLFVTWAIVVVLFFSISQSKLPGYVLTALVALGVLVARVVSLAIRSPEGRAAAIVRRGVIALAAVSAVVALVVAVELRSPDTLHRLFRIRPDELEAIRPAFRSLLWTFAAVAILAVAHAVVLSRNDIRMVRAGTAVIPFVLLPLSLVSVVFGGVRRYAEARSARPLASSIAALAPNADVACLECLPTGLPFYLRRPVTVISRDGRETTSNYIVFSLSRARQWPPVIVPLAARDQWLAERERPIYLIAGDGRRASLDSLAGLEGHRSVEIARGWWGALLVPGGRH
jgi:4-amino-4-deoxy-L-arabinose transferase-like glycosyltransferase